MSIEQPPAERPHAEPADQRPPVAVDDQSGGERVLAGRYALREPIGRGGVGTVWRATDLVLDREVAIKELRLPDDLTEDERNSLLRRTTREARVAGRLSHPNVVTVLDVVNEDGRPWIVMELVVARTLAEIIDIAGPLPYPRVAEIGLQLISALKAAHDEGIVHRDVKPENVMISEDGRVVLTDFGLAAWTGESALSSSGRIIGSPSYLPPERAKAGPVGPPSDLWSLGATLYAAVEGHPPYGRKGYIAILRGDELEEPAPAANAGPLAPVLAGLLKVDPQARLTAENATAMLRIASLAPWAPETSPETAARSAEAVRQENQEKLSAVDHFRAGAEVLRNNLHEQVSHVSDALQRHRPETVSALLTAIRESTDALGLTSSGKHRSERSRKKQVAVVAGVAAFALLLLSVVLWALVFRT
ncbi:serine/threonine-protein kinase [Thermobifida alba]|uniref:serine/threonine-protein kinase n=1 Tax=Thermobifida alba TaxID=53522 RepID=UPI0020BF2EEA|nr:serine/threonine-protein kinase [Thermobifida alba]